MSTETRFCKLCNTEKPITQFHRRGRGYQKACKSCRNQREAERYQAQGKTPRPRPIIEVNRDELSAMETRILALEPRLRAKAAAFACDGFSADDLYSEMVEVLLTKVNSESSDAFIIQRAHYIALANYSKRATYNYYVDEFTTDADEQPSSSDTNAARATEDEIIQREMLKLLESIIKSLPNENQKVIAMLRVGMNQREIARELKVSEQSLSERVGRIRVALADALQRAGVMTLDLSFAKM